MVLRRVNQIRNKQHAVTEKQYQLGEKKRRTSVSRLHSTNRTAFFTITIETMMRWAFYKRKKKQSQESQGHNEVEC